MAAATVVRNDSPMASGSRLSRWAMTMAVTLVPTAAPSRLASCTPAVASPSWPAGANSTATVWQMVKASPHPNAPIAVAG